MGQAQQNQDERIKLNGSGHQAQFQRFHFNRIRESKFFFPRPDAHKKPNCIILPMNVTFNKFWTQLDQNLPKKYNF